jgi:Holliday junction resolvase RusA-like endonuclease
MTEIKFTVPGKPKGKARPRFRVVNPKGKKSFVQTYTPKETQSEEGAIRHFASLAMAGRPPLDGALIIHMCAYRDVPASWPKKRRERCLAGLEYPTSKPDYDNYAKMQDAINGVVFTDDALIVDAHIFKRYSAIPRLVVIVKHKEG